MSLRAAVTIACLLLSLPAVSHAQTWRLRGKLVDRSTSAAVPGAAVKLTRFTDTTMVQRAVSKEDGSFEVTGLEAGNYRFEAVRMGYAPARSVVRMRESKQDMGEVRMDSQSLPIAGVTVTESPSPAVQRADTTEFRASAVKTAKDASAEDLVQKLPGVTVENGQVQAQGQAVQQVLVNGRPFFGSDPTAAMRNLPADVVDRIQVFDQASDQSQFSGFDDGQTQRTMNFILRDQKLQFGRVTTGYGDDDRYQVGLNGTVVRGPTRVSVLGMSNNINQRNFSPQDLFGAMTGSQGGGPPGMRMMMMGGGGRGMMGGGGGGMQIMRMGGGGGSFDPSSFLVNQQNGITTTHSGGINYVGEWGPRVKASASLFGARSDTDNQQSLLRQYVPPQDSLVLYDQATLSDNLNDNQRFDARFEWTPDSTWSFVMTPRIYLQQLDQGSSGEAQNRTATESVIGSSISDTRSLTDGGNLSNRFTMRRRFHAKRGRNLTAELNVGLNARDTEGENRSWTETLSGGDVTRDSLDQRSQAESVTRTLSGRVSFTEPLSPMWQAQAFYSPSLTRSTSDTRVFDRDDVSGDYDDLATDLSNSLESRVAVQNGGVSFLMSKGVWRWLSSAALQEQRVQSVRSFPEERTLWRRYTEVLPSMQLTANFPSRSSLRLAWNTSTNAPSITQLQDVVNNSNPLALSTGNPNLRPTYSHTLSLRASAADPARSRSRFAFLNLTRTNNPIVTSYYTAPTDTTIAGVALARGTQLSIPVNRDESWSANLFGVMSLPATVLKSNWSVNSGLTWTRTPTLNQEIAGRTDNWSIRGGSTLASNISQNLDFTLSYQGRYNMARRTSSSGGTGDYFTHSASLRLNATVGPGITIRQEMTHTLQTQADDAFDPDNLLWTTSLGKRFAKDGRGEFRISATDVLEQERSAGRSITETYIEDTRDRVLGRYVQAVLSYSFR